MLSAFHDSWRARARISAEAGRYALSGRVCRVAIPLGFGSSTNGPSPPRWGMRSVPLPGCADIAGTHQLARVCMTAGYVSASVRVWSLPAARRAFDCLAPRAGLRSLTMSQTPSAMAVFGFGLGAWARGAWAGARLSLVSSVAVSPSWFANSTTSLRVLWRWWTYRSKFMRFASR